MNCHECLSELATGSLRDLTPDSAVMLHCVTCPYCGPLATALRDREYNAATVLNNLPPTSSPITVAETAAMVSRRRRLGKVAVFLTGAALVATFWISLFTTGLGRSVIGGGASSGPETETIPLSCLSPEKAAELVGPYLRSSGSSSKIYHVDKSRVAAITIHGTPHEIAQSSAVIQQFETNPNACQRPSIAEQIRQMQEELRKAGMDQPIPEPAPVSASTPVSAPAPVAAPAKTPGSHRE